MTKWYDDKGETENEEKERLERETNEKKAEEEEQERMKNEKAETEKQKVREETEAKEKQEHSKEGQKAAALSSLPQKGMFHSAFRYRCLILWIVSAYGLSRTTNSSNHTSLAPQTTSPDGRLFISAC